MAIGPGRYDRAATVARISSDAAALVLIVVDGECGSGFSVQIDPARLRPDVIQPALVPLLRDVADRIEADLAVHLSTPPTRWERLRSRWRVYWSEDGPQG